MRFFVRRAIFYLVTAWAAVTINFVIPRLMPGDPVAALLAKSQGRIDSSAEDAIRVLFGLDKDVSIWQQYVHYWGLLLHGNLGISFMNFPTPVVQVIQQSLPWTVGLVGIATVISFIIGTLIGTGIGWRRGTWADSLLPISTFFSAVPYFWLGLIAIALFSVTLGWFPTNGSFALSLGFIVGGTLIMEMVFSYQGIGFLLYQAVGNHDYPLMQGCFLVITLAVLLANIAADFVYAALDPRTRQEG